MLRLCSKVLGGVIMALAVIGFMSGFAWLISNTYQGLLVQSIAAHNGEAARALSVVQSKVDGLSYPLLQVIRAQVMIMSAILAYIIFKHETFYPKWVALFTPFVLILLVFSTLLFMPSIGKYFVPAALNVAHFIFFRSQVLSPIKLFW